MRLERVTGVHEAAYLRMVEDVPVPARRRRALDGEDLWWLPVAPAAG